MKILVWHEDSPQEQKPSVRRAYPDGMQAAIGSIFDGKGYDVQVGWQSQKDCGFSDEALDGLDLIIYWAHCKHSKLPDEIADKIAKKISEGTGAIFLHSAHPSKPFTRICGATGALRWREDGKFERIFNVNPTHPIASGIGEHFYIPKEEMYGEYFDIGKPDEIVFMGWFPGGELCRSGVTYTYGKGKVFYFQPGHETFPNYYQKEIRKIIYNAAHWACGIELPQVSYTKTECSHEHALMNSFIYKVKK